MGDDLDTIESESVGAPIAPRSIETDRTVARDRHRGVILYAVVLTYVIIVGSLAYCILFRGLSEHSANLVAATALAPLGAIVGGIVAFYFESRRP
jgi:drug/metabolite transporter (DMT)-like permease